MKSIRTFFTIFFFASFFPQIALTQYISQELCTTIGHVIDSLARKEIVVGEIKIDSGSIEDKQIKLFANDNCSYIPFRKENVASIYREVSSRLPQELAEHRLQIYTDGHRIEELIPPFFCEEENQKRPTFTNKVDKPLITKVSRPYSPTKGLNDRHIALWQSHGYYYESKLTRWEWQRARIFQTVEDLYTQSYVLPFLVPMLERAGATVLLPRERDTQDFELIIDNDNSLNNTSEYIEHDGAKQWSTGIVPGFAHRRKVYKNFENPFTEGTYRQIETVKFRKKSFIEWFPNIPKKGKYAVYVSYKTLENSTSDAFYTVFHKGGRSEFKLNQQMGGGTWIYLGHFAFDTGKNSDCKITLSNSSDSPRKILTADAVKIGGGYGNIARSVSDEEVTDHIVDLAKPENGNIKQNTKTIYPSEISGYPRFCEAARYWMQWAGVPDSVYSESQGKNDYTDDYKSRGRWVNYLSGGSVLNPDATGLSIPIDMAFAFHSDAGVTMNDSIIGTLGIFYTDSNGVFANGASRYESRNLTDLVLSNITNDIKMLYEPNWSRRGMWNKSYYEARVPNVPTMLLELLSHQNFADMRYGLDPRFRFTVSRSIYKGILQFLSTQYKTPYVVQPLPVDHLSLRFTGGNEVELTWQPVNDPLEATAQPDSYLVYTRTGNSDFDQGRIVKGTSLRMTQPIDVICSYKVTALNKGGESFPSEILSAAKKANSRGTVLIVNGFDRISAPADFEVSTDSIAGFLDQVDHGVPYIEDISYTGSMKEFRRPMPWMDDDASGFGDSYSNYETKVIAGNTFDYPAVHGTAILQAGYSFVSCSDEVIEANTTSMNGYTVVDLILGKERQTKMGRNGATPLAFKTFSKKMQETITAYCQTGGNFFVSGAYVGSDLWDNPLAIVDESDKSFATKVLKYRWRVGQAAIEGKVESVASSFFTHKMRYSFYNELNTDSYVVESPDAIEPADEDAATVMRYSGNNLSAGVAFKGQYKSYVLGFPFEAIRTAKEREQLMKAILTFFADETL